MKRDEAGHKPGFEYCWRRSQLIGLEFVVHSEAANRVMVLEAKAAAAAIPGRSDSRIAKVDIEGLGTDRPVWNIAYSSPPPTVQPLSHLSVDPIQIWPGQPAKSSTFPNAHPPVA